MDTCRDLLMSRGFVKRSGEALARIAVELKNGGDAGGVATPNPSEIGGPL